MQNMLGALNIPAKFITGYDWKDLTDDQIEIAEKYSYQRRGSVLMPGEIACAMGHLAIYRQMVQHEIEYALILEDDVVLNLDFLRVLKAILESNVKLDLVNFLTDAQFILTEQLQGMYHMTRFIELANRTSCYLLSLEGALKLSALNTPLSWGADELTGTAGEKLLSSGGVAPAVAQLAPFASQIQNQQYPARRYALKTSIGLKLNTIKFFGKHALNKLLRLRHTRNWIQIIDSLLPLPTDPDFERLYFEQINPIIGWLSQAESQLLFYASTFANNDVVEIGSYQGRSTAALGLGLKRRRLLERPDDSESRLHAIDPHTGDITEVNAGLNVDTWEIFNRNIDTVGIRGLINVYRDLSVNAAQEFVDVEVGVLFVDGWHTFDAVCEDFRSYLPFLNNEATVIFDDWEQPDIRRALNDLRAELPRVLGFVGKDLIFTNNPNVRDSKIGVCLSRRLFLLKFLFALGICRRHAIGDFL